MNEQTLFNEALQRDPADRPAFLDEACGANKQLRERVEKLIELHENAGDFLERPAAVDRDTVDELLPEKAGVQIGPYKLLQQIGEGGMGVVFMAEQTHPVHRTVALKVIKPGMDSRQVIARFDGERQALALMDHVNIARVLDAGATQAGRPYFVMELVHGVPITKYCDDNHLTLRQRLELFVPVCQAIQHAHQKGVIHRDIKPSNVMITLYDGKPVPKVIDFGVSKATEQKLTESTLFTQYGAMVGTLEYMSPEQAEMSALGVDTRSDIYSLGVLLYELLTGSTPLGHERMKQAAFAEILRLIKEEEPPRPSTRLSESGEALASISARRHAEPAKLSRLLRGELDWIAMKALEKDRNGRYATANGLMMDVQRYLADEPVEACPPSSSYRLRKFVRRNRPVLIMTAVICTALVLGTVVSVWQAIRAQRAEALAEQRLQTEAEQRKLAQGNASEADKQRQLAERNLRKAQDAVDQMLTRVASERLQHVPQMEQLRRELYEDALKFNQQFLDDKSTDPAVRAETGRAYYRLGNIYDYLGRPDQAEAVHRKAVSHFEQLLAEFPGNRTYREGWAYSKVQLATVLRHVDRSVEAEEVLGDVRKLYEELQADFSDVVEYRRRIADSYRNLGHALTSEDRATEREAAYRRALGLYEQLAAEFPQQPEYRCGTADALQSLAAVLRRVGRYPEAEDASRRALAGYEQLVAEFPKPSLYRQNRGTAFNGLGEVLSQTGRPVEAEQAFRRAVEDYEKLSIDVPGAPYYRRSLANYARHLADVLQTNGHTAEAEKCYRQVATVFDKLVTDFPGSLHDRKGLAQIYEVLANLLMKSHRAQEAETEFRNAVDVRSKLVADFPTELGFRTELAGAQVTLGRFLTSLKREDASITFQEAVAIQNKMESDFSSNAELRKQLAEQHLKAAGQLHEAKQFAGAEQIGRLALSHFATLAAEPPHRPEDRYRLAHCYCFLGAPLHGLGRLDDARQCNREAVAVLEKLVAEMPSVKTYRSLLAENCSHLGAHAVINGLLGEAEQRFLQATQIFEQLTTENPGSEYNWMASNYLRLAQVFYRTGRTHEAEEACRKVGKLHSWDADGYNSLAWLLATGTDPVIRNPARAVEWAAKAVELAPKESNHWNTLGVAHYRAGDWKAAVKALEQAESLKPGKNLGYNGFFLAMAEWQLGRTAEARKWYDQAVQWMDRQAKDNEELRGFRDEAADLLKIDE